MDSILSECAAEIQSLDLVDFARSNLSRLPDCSSRKRFLFEFQKSFKVANFESANFESFKGASAILLVAILTLSMFASLSLQVSK